MLKSAGLFGLERDVWKLRNKENMLANCHKSLIHIVMTCLSEVKVHFWALSAGHEEKESDGHL